MAARDDPSGGDGGALDVQSSAGAFALNSQGRAGRCCAGVQVQGPSGGYLCPRTGGGPRQLVGGVKGGPPRRQLAGGRAVSPSDAREARVAPRAAAGARTDGWLRVVGAAGAAPCPRRSPTPVRRTGAMHPTVVEEERYESNGYKEITSYQIQYQPIVASHVTPSLEVTTASRMRGLRDTCA
eukprot:scaffold5169_cov366-Prasinococcus_capsulatus_cf.AAC.2